MKIDNVNIEEIQFPVIKPYNFDGYTEIVNQEFNCVHLHKGSEEIRPGSFESDPCSYCADPRCPRHVRVIC